jgi:hypothetical protein
MSTGLDHFVVCSDKDDGRRIHNDYVHKFQRKKYFTDDGGGDDHRQRSSIKTTFATLYVYYNLYLI